MESYTQFTLHSPHLNFHGLLPLLPFSISIGRSCNQEAYLHSKTSIASRQYLLDLLQPTGDGQYDSPTLSGSLI